MKPKQRKMRTIFWYLLAIALAFLVYAFISMKTMTGKVTQDENMFDSYTIEQISQHNNIADCWITNNNNVYDITLFIKDFKESDCGQETSLDDYFTQLLGNYQVGIVE